jgi:predicted amidohydrolase YtcJ
MAALFARRGPANRLIKSILSDGLPLSHTAKSFPDRPKEPFIMTKLLKIIAILCLTGLNSAASAQTMSLQEVAGKLLGEGLPKVTIYRAKEVLTLDPARPTATAVAVVGPRILATGSLETLKASLGDQDYQIDDTFAEKVIVPGFISQHDHPVLSALTLACEVLSIEDWVLPTGTVAAVKDKTDFLQRLATAQSRLATPDEPLVSWGYHESFFGRLTRTELDGISQKRPIVVWGRSCHEVILNSAAMQKGGLTREVFGTWTPSERQQSDFDTGHFWEQGVFAAARHVARMIATPERLRMGLVLARDYMHSKGITYGNEPGGILVKPLQDEVNAVFSQPSMPFRWSFMVDGKSICEKYTDDAEAIEQSKRLASWYGGMTSQADKMAKLFADGAIFSQLMQVREPYTDGHQGAWMTDLDLFERAFRVYWDAGYQIHVHVNGDAGLDRVLNALERNIRRNPRFDHRTTIVHFAVSAKDQVARIKALGCLVSGNPYYVTALADNYGKVGLGPQRADQMVRMGDVERAGISYSYHSDMPMAPADPLFLMWCGVNRITTSGRIAGANQRVSREGALRAVTIEAAYSLKMEHEIGSIVSGKLANFTILGANPVTCDPMKIREIGVWGTVHEGRVLPVRTASAEQTMLDREESRRVELASIRARNAAQLNALELPLESRSIFFDPPNLDRLTKRPAGPSCTCGSPLLHAIFSAYAGESGTKGTGINFRN